MNISAGEMSFQWADLACHLLCSDIPLSGPRGVHQPLVPSVGTTLDEL